jgi:hypothetical protein
MLKGWVESNRTWNLNIPRGKRDPGICKEIAFGECRLYVCKFWLYSHWCKSRNWSQNRRMLPRQRRIHNLLHWRRWHWWRLWLHSQALPKPILCPQSWCDVTSQDLGRSRQNCRGGWGAARNGRECGPNKAQSSTGLHDRRDRVFLQYERGFSRLFNSSLLTTTDRLFGAFYTARCGARTFIKLGNKGASVFTASMASHRANKVCVSLSARYWPPWAGKSFDSIGWPCFPARSIHISPTTRRRLESETSPILWLWSGQNMEFRLIIWSCQYWSNLLGAAAAGLGRAVEVL